MLSSSYNIKQHDNRLKQLSIDDSLYLLALVCTNDLDKLKELVQKNQKKFDINFNFVYRVPVQDKEDVIEEVTQLLALNESERSINNFIHKNKLMKRLMHFYNLQILKSNLENEDVEEDYLSYNSSNNSFNSSYGSQVFDNYFRIQDETGKEDIDEIISNAVIYNKFFELSLLHVAMFLENYNMIKFMLRQGASIGAIRPNHIHSIHIALYQSNNTILDMLLSELTEDEIKQGVLNKLTDDRGYNPIQIAIYYANHEALEILSHYGADFNYETQIGSSPLIWALENIEVPYEIVSRLLELGANPNIIDKIHTYTPLIVAVLADRLDLVQLLIKYGANVNKIIDSATACCALQVAIDRIQHINSYDIFHFLLKAGANPTFYEDESDKSIKRQISNEDGHIERTSNGPLIDAITLNNKTMVEMLLYYGAKAHTDVNGTFSPMSTACFLGFLEIVELLIKYKVDPIASCKNSNTPLTVALSMNHENIANLLLTYYKTQKGSINAQNGNGDHALLYATMNRNSKMVRELLKLGANCNLSNKYNVTPLWYSIYNNDIESFILLLPHTKDLNKSSAGIDYNGFQFAPELIYQTPLSYVELAEERNCYSMIYFLKLFGAKVPQNVILNLATKLKEFENTLSLKLVVETSGLIENIKKLECLLKFLNTPLSLARFCRLYARLNNLDFKNVSIAKNLKEFLEFKRL